MTNTGPNYHGSLVEEAAPWAAEGDWDGVGQIWCATSTVSAEATVTWMVNLCAVASLMEQACGNIRLVARLARPWPLMQKKKTCITGLKHQAARNASC